jgi:putative alpha-1,2-mannosidase
MVYAGKLNGAWQTPFDPREVNYNFTEANSWQYSFFVPHDILTFIELHGGNEKICSTTRSYVCRKQRDVWK